MFVIAIPSYNRIKILKTHTLKFLAKHSVALENIFIFVAPDNYEEYCEAFPEYQVIKGKSGLREQRNYIASYFPEHTHVLSMDDDIKDLIIRQNNRLNALEDFETIIDDCFSDTKKNNAHLFGFYPVMNKFFMKDSITTDFRFIIGSCYGFIVSDPPLLISIKQKEDYELSILHFLRDNIVLRYNYITIKSNYYKTKGGLQSFSNRLEEQNESVDYLIQTYPSYFAKKKSFKSGFPELRVITKKR